MGCPADGILQGFVDGTLVGPPFEAVVAHLDGCGQCRACVSAAAPPEFDRVGRYRLMQPLGVGAMGIVYAAHDPELGRAVAIKLIRPELRERALQARLVAEAQALARLSHPNVVAVHDVGYEGAQPYVVMALVHGRSLRSWLFDERRSLEAVLDAFAQAAAGLDAAHRAGLVHRDFKPENVLVTDEGLVRVTDFGLAADERRGPREVSEGSPAYMAPEQASGVAVDARSDQFSFFVALKEALEGQHAPRWLEAAIARGLDADPSKRHESMQAVHRLLAGAPARRVRRRVGVALATLSSIAAVAFFVHVAGRRSAEARCEVAASAIDAVVGVEQLERVSVAFVETQRPLAERAADEARARLLQQARDWRSARAALCRREAASGPSAFDRAEQRCLDQRAASLEAVVETLAFADGEVVERTGAVLDTLGSIEACSNVGLVALEAPRLAVEHELSRATVEQSKVALAAGRYEEALTLAGRALDMLPTPTPLGWKAQALLLRGTAHGRLGHTDSSEKDLLESASAASAAGTPLVEIEAWIRLMQFVGVGARRFEVGHRYGAYAEAALARLPPVPLLEAERLGWAAALLTQERRYTEALSAAERQFALVRAHLGPGHPQGALALDAMAGALAGLGRRDEARQRQREACEALEAEVGPSHPRLAACLNNLGGVVAAEGEWHEAIALRRRALDMLSRWPSAPGQHAAIHRNLARSLEAVGRLEEAARERAAAESLEPGR